MPDPVTQFFESQNQPVPEVQDSPFPTSEAGVVAPEATPQVTPQAAPQVEPPPVIEEEEDDTDLLSGYIDPELLGQLQEASWVSGHDGGGHCPRWPRHGRSSDGSASGSLSWSV